jgi:hypothetical protein
MLLPPTVQEDTMDLLDHVAMHPELLRSRAARRSIVLDLASDVGGMKFYVFLTVRRDDVGKRIVVSSIGHYVQHP